MNSLVVSPLAAAGRTLVAPWLLPVGRVIVLASPALLIGYEKDNVDKAMLAGIWSILFARWVFGRADSNWRNSDIIGDALVLLLAACTVLLISTQTAAAWLLPLLGVLAIICSVYLFYPSEWKAPHPKRDTPNIRPVWLTACTTILLGGQGFALSFLDPDTKAGSIRSSLLLVQGALSIMLASRQGTRWIQSWMLIQLCTLPHYYRRDDTLFIVALYSLICALFLGIAHTNSRRKRTGIPILSQLWQLVDTILRLAGKLFVSPVLYYNAVLLAFSVLLTTFADKWYTSTASFPAPMQSNAEELMSRTNNYIKPFWEITGDSFLQEVLVPIAPSMSTVRLGLHRILYALTPLLVMVRDGVSKRYTPLADLAAFLLFIAGPCLSTLAIACRLFPRGEALSRSRVFWLTMTMCNVMFLLLSQSLGETGVTILRVLYRGSTYKRQFTDAGRVAFLASWVILAATMLLTIADHGDDDDEDDDEEDDEVALVTPSAHTQGKYSTVTNEDIVLEPKKSILKRILDFCTAPYLLMLFAAFLVFISIFATGKSPVREFSVAKVETLPPEMRWLKLTPLDRLSPLINTIRKLIINAIGPEAVLIPLITIAMRIAESYFECLPCHCFDVGPFVDAYEATSDWFSDSFRRRLLQESESIIGFDPYSQKCESNGGGSCDGLNVCVDDIVRPIAKLAELLKELVRMILNAGTTLLVEQIISRISLMDDLETFFTEVQNMLDVDFDLSSFAELGMPNFSAIVFAGWDVPDVYIPDLSQIIIIAAVFVAIVAVLSLFGFAKTVLGVALRMTIVSVIVAFYAVVGAAIISAYFIRDEVRIFIGYDVVVKFDASVCIWYALSLALVVMASLAFLMETLHAQSSIFVSPRKNNKRAAALPPVAESNQAVVARPTSSVELTVTQGRKKQHQHQHRIAK